jgi:glycosyltransferase involved in cell wall biosynthesis
MPPLVSVIVPNYNHAPYLKQRLDSILGQTFQDMEIILLDDASTDESKKVLDQYEGANIQKHFNQVNSGSPFKQWNKGVALAKGKYIWLAESDDYCENVLLEKLVNALEADDKRVLAFAQTTLVDESGKTINSFQENYRFLFQTDRWEHDFEADGREECKNYFLKYNTIPNASGVLMRRDAYLATGGAPENFRLNGDWMLYTRILLRGSFYFIADHLNYFRVHQQTQRNRARRNANAFPEILEIQELIQSKMEIPPHIFHQARKTVGEWWIGGLAHQRWLRRGFFSENGKLYRVFSPYFRFLWLRILWHFVYATGWYILYKARLLPVAKKLRSKLFPGKYFNY